ncbi:protein-tyrosine phosphatase family protein [Nocardioides bizhenqiangii]|uniref:Protein-tyrosine phosphatase family protein n=1 Tax=Nocardioides bizhenqiangii TaxID=3095076 RepID=A0ABZ0ZQN1_9ACTN|nr:protein-tyrosine phosphatase family protein [Nocardioides sp. HM61]WQQ26557.1 protein-tyrosine phosphatase family protein [Nocardioides sp. HM61]
MSEWPAAPGVVELPDGRRVCGTGIRRPRDSAPAPEFAVYLLGRDPQVTDWPSRWVRWRDFHLPASAEDAVAVLTAAHTRAATERVEVACAGGRGRTGTALAVLAVLSGVGPDEAVAWVRTHYHPEAVETRSQRRWVEKVGHSLLVEGGPGHLA